ncbi:MAG TPA: peptide ABC transporter substrate-binding protein [Microthrixaceae bacterium]|nr:peptide ABC transporter substrate-binding protein [Microthrixaceae bacterium]
MKLRNPMFGVFAILVVVTLIAAGCGDTGDDSSDDGDSTENTTEAASSADCRTLEYEDVEEGGEFVDYAQLADAGSNTSFDPQVVQTLDEAQLTVALFDGLTDFDYTDTCNPELKPLVAESWEANEDATEFTFTIKEGQEFSNGEEILPSNFKIAWERLGNAELASYYGYLMAYVKDGDKLIAGEVDTLDSIVADDENMTLKVTLDAPNADFPQIVSFSAFSPISKTDYEKIGNTTGWGTAGISIGNGPFKLESAGTADSGDVVLVRNDNWKGNVLGDTRAVLDKLTFKITADVESSYQAFESGEGDDATIPPGRYADAIASYPNTTKEPQLSTYFWDFGYEDPEIAGEENLKLRQAISMAIDRDEINEKVYEGVRAISTGITPPGIPGFKPGICDYCTTDPEAAKELYDEWVADGGELSAPLKLAFNAGGGHEPVAQIVQANLKTVLGIDSELTPVIEDYFQVIGKPGACQVCRTGWGADYPTYGNFMVDQFGAVAIDGNNIGRYNDPEFEELIAQAQSEPDPAARGELYVQAEERLLNETTGTIPLNWYVGDQVYREGVVNFVQPPLVNMLWEKIGKRAG